MLDLKKTLAKLLNNKPKFQTPTDITEALATTSGWTCPADGILRARVHAQTSGLGSFGYYVYDETTAQEVISMYEYNFPANVRNGDCCPVIKGHVYRQTYFAGQKRLAQYYPMSMGGVVSRLLKGLQSLAYKGVVAC